MILIIAALLAITAAAAIGSLIHTRRALATEVRWADAERAKHIEVETAHRAAVGNARALAQAALEAHRQQQEIASLAIDAAEGLVHLTNRLKVALHDAAILIEGKPTEWRRLASSYRVNSEAADIINTLRPALIADWRSLIDEAQAEVDEQARKPPLASASALQLRVVGGNAA